MFCYLEKILICLFNDSLKHIVLAGDLNVDILKTHDPETVELINLLRSFDIYCVHETPTRFKACLDVVASNITSDHVEVRLLNQDILSDHAGVWTTFTLDSFTFNESRDRPSLKKREVEKKRILSHEKINDYKQMLLSANWMGIYTNDVNISVNVFLNILSMYLNLSCPKMSVNSSFKGKKGSLVKWFTPDLENMRKLLLALYDKWKSTCDPDDKLLFSKFKAQYRQEIISAKIEANGRFISKSTNQCKAAWLVAKKEGNLVSTKKQIIPISPEQMNNFFVNASNVQGNDQSVTNTDYKEF